MKNYLSYFKIWFLVVGVFLVIGIGCKIYTNSLRVDFVRKNTEAATEERVFDYADKMSAEEENRLREKIAKKKRQVLNSEKNEMSLFSLEINLFL